MALFPTSRLYIDGVLQDAENGRTYDNIGPATGTKVGEAANASPMDMDAAIAAARRAFDESDWPHNRDLRVASLVRFRDALKTLADEYRARISAETGAKGRDLFRPLRMALTGQQHGPELANLLPLMGYERALARLEGQEA